MKKILIAEDDPFIRDIAIAKLKEKQYDVQITDDGTAVLPLLLKGAFDILLLDLQLPGKYGFDILKEVRASKSLAELPVVVFSNENGPDIEKEVIKHKAEYFFKALTGTGELVAKIEKLLASNE